MSDFNELLNKYNIKTIDELESVLKTDKLIKDGKIAVLDMPSYNHCLQDLNRFLSLELKLGYKLEEFISAFMEGDALWAYNTKTGVVGEFKVDDPFSKEIKISVSEEFPIDKSKLN